MRHCRPGGIVLLYSPKRVTTATWPSCTIMKPLRPQITTAITARPPNSLGEPDGSDGMPPPVPPGRGPRGPPPPRLLPNSAPIRLLKSRQTSSRSGGPSLFRGRCDESSSLRPPSLRPPRPQPASFRLHIFDIERIVSRDLS